MEQRNKLSRLFPASWVFWHELRKCRRDEEKLFKTAPPNTKESDSNGSLYEYQRESLDLFQLRRSLITNNYRRTADALCIPLPDPAEEGMWERIENDFTGRTTWTLTTSGERAAIMLIREAEKHNREVYAFWLTGLTGIGGVLIGVISVWPK